MTIVTVEEEIVPVEIAVDSAFDNEPIVETFNTFVDTGPVIAPLASNAQIEQQEEIVELEVLVESIEAEVEQEMTQLDTNIEEPVLEAEVESVAQIIEEENKDDENTIEEEVVEESVKEEENNNPNAEDKEEKVKEVVEEKNDDAVEETVVVEAKPKKLIQMTEKQKADAKAKKMKEIIKDKLASLAKDMGKATSLKEQAAIQAKIQALVNFVPGFNGYGGQVQAVGDFYGSDSIYTATNVPENNRGLLNGLASQLLHEQMVDMQYK